MSVLLCLCVCVCFFVVLFFVVAWYLSGPRVLLLFCPFPRLIPSFPPPSLSLLCAPVGYVGLLGAAGPVVVVITYLGMLACPAGAGLNR